MFAALNEVQVKPLVLKGGALAYTHYPNPALRPRGDTDLLVAPSARGRTEETLRRLGYTHGGGMSGNLVSYQASVEPEGTGLSRRTISTCTGESTIRKSSRIS